MAKDTSVGPMNQEGTMELEQFVRTTLQAIIRGMDDFGKEGRTVEGLSIRGQEAKVDFKLSIEAVEGKEIHVAKINGKASPNSNRIEFSIKIGQDPSCIPPMVIM